MKSGIPAGKSLFFVETTENILINPWALTARSMIRRSSSGGDQVETFKIVYIIIIIADNIHYRRGMG
jgi:hypothetical protein